MKEDVKMKLRQKKKITLREYHKKRMAAGVAMVATQIFENVVEHFKLDETIWASIIFAVLAALALIFAVIWLYASCQNVDEEDELAKENMLKAHENVSKLFLYILALVVILTMFWDGSITVKINSDRILHGWLIIWFGYMTLESGFFLRQEGKLSTDEEDE